MTNSPLRPVETMGRTARITNRKRFVSGGVLRNHERTGLFRRNLSRAPSRAALHSRPGRPYRPCRRAVCNAPPIKGRTHVKRIATLVAAGLLLATRVAKRFTCVLPLIGGALQ